MRLVRVVLIAICASIAPGILWAEEFPNPAAVDKVISANPQADGQSYALKIDVTGRVMRRHHTARQKAQFGQHSAEP